MKFLTPKNLTEALELASHHPTYKILAGGTDLCVQMNSGITKPDGIINIWGLEELRGIKEDRDYIELWALTTYADIVESSIVEKFIPALAESCKTIGAKQIQNRGTIGGNVANASPAGDSLPVLLAYDSEIEVSSVKGSRRIPFSNFYKGYRKIDLKEDEIITKFRIPKPEPDEKSQFVKIGTRKAQTISKVMACFRLTLEDNNVGEGLRPLPKVKAATITFGSVAKIPVRLKKTEKVLIGSNLDDELIKRAQKSVEKEVSPIDDIRSTGNYRRHLCSVLLSRFLKSI